ncbi:gp21 [Burkholderia sp. YI23]|nr:gp21 [Burkholderia sp. YI23]
MAAGLQIWDASGRLVVDFTTRLARIVGSQYIDGVQSQGQVSSAFLAQGDIFVAFQQEGLWGFIDMDVSRPIFAIPGRGGTTIGWAYSAANGTHNKRIKGQMFYGVK